MSDLSTQCGRALVALQTTGRIRVAFLPGMLLHGAAGTISVRVTEMHGVLGGAWRPDLADAATVGCLLALLREATGKTEEGEARAAALIALAGVP